MKQGSQNTFIVDIECTISNIAQQLNYQDQHRLDVREMIACIQRRWSSFEDVYRAATQIVNGSTLKEMYTSEMSRLAREREATCREARLVAQHFGEREGPDATEGDTAIEEAPPELPPTWQALRKQLIDELRSIRDAYYAALAAEEQNKQLLAGMAKLSDQVHALSLQVAAAATSATTETAAAASGAGAAPRGAATATGNDTSIFFGK